MTCRHILGTRIDEIHTAALAAKIVDWASRGLSRSVCLADSATLLACQDREDLRRVLNGSDVVVAGDRAVAWALRFALVPGASAVDPQALLHTVAARAAAQGIPVTFDESSAFVGYGTQAVVIRLNRETTSNLRTTLKFVWRVLAEIMDPDKPRRHTTEPVKPQRARSAALK